MKALSASIIILAGAVLLAVGSLVTHHDTQTTLQLIGGGVGLIGFWAWWKAYREPQ